MKLLNTLLLLTIFSVTNIYGQENNYDPEVFWTYKQIERNHRVEVSGQFDTIGGTLGGEKNEYRLETKTKLVTGTWTYGIVYNEGVQKPTDRYAKWGTEDDTVKLNQSCNWTQKANNGVSVFVEELNDEMYYKHYVWKDGLLTIRIAIMDYNEKEEKSVMKIIDTQTKEYDKSKPIELKVKGKITRMNNW
jgi:hypothetical protein